MATSFIDFKALSKRIAEVREELAHLLHLETFATGTSAKKRGRPANAGVRTKSSKSSAKHGRKSGKRGALGVKILQFLGTKGKEGAHVKDIATAVGTKPANVTAWTYTTGKGKVKRVKPATFSRKD
jgi:hypothetical protein